LTTVRAVWCVKKKTFTDVVMKIYRDSIINRVTYWVETQLITDRDICDEVVEGSSLRETRKELNTTIDNMEHVLQSFGPIMMETSPSEIDWEPNIPGNAPLASPKQLQNTIQRNTTTTK